MATFRNLVDKLRSMIDAGQLKVTIRNGRMLIVLPNDVLFDSGRIDLKTAGKQTLTQVAQVLAGISDRRFLVAGHTDNLPIKTRAFPVELGAVDGSGGGGGEAVRGGGDAVGGGRGGGVRGVRAGGFERRAGGAGSERRIEIILEPNLSDLPNLESLLSEVKR